MESWFPAATSPGRIAVVGASADAARSPYLVNLLRAGFPGVVLPVNHRHDTVLGLPAYPSLASLPGPVDHVAVVVPARRVLSALDGLERSGARFVYIGSAGFAELGADGQRLQDDIVAAVRGAGARLLGPNGNGVMSRRSRLYATAITLTESDFGPHGRRNAALVVQSGALGAALRSIAHNAGLEIAYYFATGNEADLTSAEVIGEVAGDHSIDVVLCYLEGVRDGREFIRAVSKARASGQRVVALKVGRSAEGERVAASHTASVTGDSRTFADMCVRAGVALAESPTQLIDIGVLGATVGSAAPSRIGVVSISGGMSALIADALPAGLSLPAQWPEPIRSSIAAELPSFITVANPLDGSAELVRDRETFVRILTAVQESPTTDVTVVGLTYLHSKETMLAEAIMDVAGQRSKPLVVVWLGASGIAKPLLVRHGVPVFDDIPALMSVLGSVRRAAAATGGTLDRAGAAGSVAELRERIAPALTEARAQGLVVMDEVLSKRVLARAGIDVVPEVTLEGAEPDQWPWPSIRLPAVAKLVSPGLAHKTDLGAVKLGLRSREAVETAVRELFRLAEQAGLPEARVVLQEQLPEGTELLVGMKRDASFGPLVVLGHGGVLAEALEDVVVTAPPLSPSDVPRLLAGLRHRRLTEGFRGRPAAATPAAAAAIARFSQLVLALPEWVTSVDVNPLIVTHDGRAVAVDALVILDQKR
jgi:acetate---CoA ligase (ADP-forming)